MSVAQYDKKPTVDHDAAVDAIDVVDAPPPKVVAPLFAVETPDPPVIAPLAAVKTAVPVCGGAPVGATGEGV